MSEDLPDVGLGATHASMATQAPNSGELNAPSALARTTDGALIGGAPMAPTAASAPSEVLLAQADELTPGTRLGSYEIIRMLGQGGMGNVYVARDVKLGRKVAVKTVRAKAQSHSARFVQEARATARFQHDNIVVIHDAGEHQGIMYMVLEYLDGHPLDAIIGTPMAPRQAVDYLIPVLRALEAAHEHGIIHRDLKPANIFVTRRGSVKVLDFGIAKALDAANKDTGHHPAVKPETTEIKKFRSSVETEAGALVGTMAYMAPEQWANADIDARTDIWALGLILWEMLAGRHPFMKKSMTELVQMAVGAMPLPDPSKYIADLPSELERVLHKCLQVVPDERFGSASDMLAALEAAIPRRQAVQLAVDACPYPGLSAFSESEASLFFGRTSDVSQVLAALDENPLLAVVGPSGVGKSSLVRAGVIPALKSKANWDSRALRPGRKPIQALARLLADNEAVREDRAVRMAELGTKIVAEPGYFGNALRRRCVQRKERLLLLVDQFEEIFTLADENNRRSFVAALLGAADDVGSEVRVVLSLRSDFLDPMTELPELAAAVTRGLVLLKPPGREQLEEALVAPAEVMGFRFEDPRMVDAMVETLEDSPSALPLLQFAGTQLWETRDEAKKLLTRTAYDAMGGIDGLLASHADAVLEAQPATQQTVIQEIFRRLVTADGTRALVDGDELQHLSKLGDVVSALNVLVDARLVVVQKDDRSGAATYEIAHETLMASWPRLQQWLAEGREHAGFLDRVKAAAKEWDAQGRTEGLLWTGDAAEDAAVFQRRFTGTLADREQAFLAAVARLRGRSRRRRRVATWTTITALLAVVVAGGFALVSVSQAEQDAQSKARLARDEADRANTMAKSLQEQIQATQDKEKARKKAQADADAKAKVVDKQGKDLAKSAEDLSQAAAELEKKNKALESALKKAREGEAAALKVAEAEKKLSASQQAAAQKAKQLRQKTEKLLALEKDKNRKLNKQLRRIENKLR